MLVSLFHHNLYIRTYGAFGSSVVMRSGVLPDVLVTFFLCWGLAPVQCLLPKVVQLKFFWSDSWQYSKCTLVSWQGHVVPGLSAGVRCRALVCEWFTSSARGGKIVLWHLDSWLGERSTNQKAKVARHTTQLIWPSSPVICLPSGRGW